MDACVKAFTVNDADEEDEVGRAIRYDMVGECNFAKWPLFVGHAMHLFLLSKPSMLSSFVVRSVASLLYSNHAAALPVLRAQRYCFSKQEYLKCCLNRVSNRSNFDILATR